MIVSRFPFPLDKGDKLRAYYQLIELSIKYNVTLVALSEKNISENDYKEVSQYCEALHIIRINWITKIFRLFACAFTNKPFQVGYFYRYKAKKTIKHLIESGGFKLIYNQLIRTTEYTKNFHEIPKVLDYMDALSMGIKRRIDLQPFYKKWIFQIEANRLVTYEREIFDYFEFKTIISEQDRKLIQHPEAKNILCVPNGISQHFFEYPEINKDVDLVFTGNMSYPPNIEASKFIVQQILPELSNCKLLISGSSPAPSLKEMAQDTKSVELTGWVDDIRESYARGKIFIAPMFIGTGMQNKLLEAMAMGLPCITTSLANNAIQGIHKKHILVADNQAEFIHYTKLLLSDSVLRDEIGRNAKDFVKLHFSWSSSINKLMDELEKKS